MKLWLNVAEGAEYAGVCKDLIYDACAAKRIRHIHIDGRRSIRMKREWIDAWFERHAEGPPADSASASAAPGVSARTETRR